MTNARFMVGAQTFAMRGITSVQGVEIPASYTGPAIFILLGVFFLMGAFANAFGLAAIGLFLVAAGVWLCFRRKTIFAVVLRTAGGEITAYQSRDRNHISQIIDALNEAIVSNG